MSDKLEGRSPEMKRRTLLKAFAVGGMAAAAGISGCVGEEGGETPTPTPTATPTPTPTTEAKKDHTIVVDYTKCTGCNICAVACAAKFGPEIAPEETENVINLEYARIRTSRFQFVDTVNICRYCNLEKWAEGTDNFPCAEVCPTDAIITVPEGEGKKGYFGMGYKRTDRERCLGLENCGKCLEICEEQFGSGMFFDPVDEKSQVCTRCGGIPACVEACPEDALEFAQPGMDGRYFAHNPEEQAELLYRKMYDVKREMGV